MFRFILLTALPVALCLSTGCGLSRPSTAISHALDVQAKYTAIYVERTLDLIDDEETKLIGIELVRNADSLKRWAHAGEKKDEKENPGRD
jgi:hypothetical protein